MEIQEIKQRLTLSMLLQHYGLKADKQARLKCPFHNDKTPSLQLYYKTQTAYCFSTNCTTHGKAIDVIDFILYYEKCSKHEALVKAAELAGGEVAPQGQAPPPTPATLLIETDSLTKTAVLSKAFTIFKKTLPLTKRAVDYLQIRNLDYNQYETGFINAGYHHELGKEVAESLIDPSCRLGRHGLIKPKPAGGYTTWAKEGIVFRNVDRTTNVHESTPICRISVFPKKNKN
jgi:hypothetical protein